tara:strand:- start:11480 stop:11797 length:318 start_codon:yes stop_codon:yes gene_type:complete
MKDWWEKHIPRIRDNPGRTALTGFWLSPQQYRFTHPVTRRTQDMVFENAERHDPDDLDTIIRDQERKALTELASPAPDRKARRVNIRRRAAMIKGREIAVNERWY